jgi:hypothetical protein
MSRTPENFPDGMGNHTPSEQTPFHNTPVELPNGQLNPQYVEYAFNRLIEEQRKNYQQHPGRFPVRVQRIWNILRGRENDVISIQALIVPFLETHDPDDSMRDAIRYTNQILEKAGIDLEIKHVTAYQLCRRSPKK